MLIKKIKSGDSDESCVFYGFSRLALMGDMENAARLQEQILSQSLHLKINEPHNMIQYLHGLVVCGIFDT